MDTKTKGYKNQCQRRAQENKGNLLASLDDLDELHTFLTVETEALGPEFCSVKKKSYFFSKKNQNSRKLFRTSFSDFFRKILR